MYRKVLAQSLWLWLDSMCHLQGQKEWLSPQGCRLELRDRRNWGKLLSHQRWLNHLDDLKLTGDLRSYYRVGKAGMRDSHDRLDCDEMLCCIDSRSTSCSSVGKLWQALGILAGRSVSNLYVL